jgi:hypothetical protein
VELFFQERQAARSGAELYVSYASKASPAWREHLRNSGHPENFAHAFDLYGRFYASAREGAKKAAAQAPAIDAALTTFRVLYPSPEVPVTIGMSRAYSAGRADGRRVYLAAEMFAAGQGIETGELPGWIRGLMSRPEEIVAAAVHEAVHLFQPPVTDPVLLVACLREGAPSFVAELVTGRVPSPELHAWCGPRSKVLFGRFARQVGSTSYEAWLGNAASQRGAEPPDVGYWIGYEIVRDYYSRAPDKRSALADIVEMRDPRSLVRASRYRWLLGHGGRGRR